MYLKFTFTITYIRNTYTYTVTSTYTSDCALRCAVLVAVQTLSSFTSHWSAASLGHRHPSNASHRRLFGLARHAPPAARCQGRLGCRKGLQGGNVATATVAGLFPWYVLVFEMRAPSCIHVVEVFFFAPGSLFPSQPPVYMCLSLLCGCSASATTSLGTSEHPP